MECRICKCSFGRFFIATEKMFGIGEQFRYFECEGCGCIQIEHYPEELSRFYKNTYYSYKNAREKKISRIVNYLTIKWVDYGLTGGGIIGRIIARFSPVPDLYESFRRYGLNRSSRFLDVGCGSGIFLRILDRGGFTKLRGIDPFLAEDIRVSERLILQKADLFSVQDSFDYISFSHSFEHLARQHEVLNKAGSLLSREGILSISIPVVGYAWRTYGANWVQLDAPRHFYIHTQKSMEILAESAGLEIIETTYNSDEFQFWGSEQYMKNIPLMDEKSFWINKVDSNLFAPKEIEAFRKKARELNAADDGDQAVFILRHKRLP